ncbi:PREDICTED: uncharacterized protein LOC109243601 [Nicotiana attenuata]|uniref:uncharacterized protein LOC109243601 n=1 Tax=Nicotiana attenuata TaxID=49451 RepID=UPI000904993E|nr:PREDICTED: uncharacterized protein LOC109243601 [Nicotiana attenuata]
MPYSYTPSLSYQPMLSARFWASAFSVSLGSFHPQPFGGNLQAFNGLDTSRSRYKEPKAKMPFLEFDRKNSKAWIRRCNRFFDLYGVDEEEKMTYVSMNLKDEIDMWFDNYVFDKRGRVTWPIFCLGVCICYGNIRPTQIIKEFKQVQQVANVESYQKKFEELRCLMGVTNPNLDEAYFVECFISGLTLDIQDNVSLANPRSLVVAYDLAKIHERKAEAMYKKFAAKSALKREEGVEEVMVEETGGIGEESESQDQEEGEVSINAVLGLGSNAKTIKIQGWAQVQWLQKPMKVKVASGHILDYHEFSPNFKWKMGKEEFVFQVGLLKVGGCDMVLGMDWLNTIAPILLHTRPLSITFIKGDKRLTLLGDQESQALSIADSKTIDRSLLTGQCSCLGQLFELSQEDLAHNKETIHEEVQYLLTKNKDIFYEPRGLPRHRSCDHQIELLPGAKPVNLRPYRYSFEQKNTIEKIVAEMLDAQTVSPGISPFASPVILVKKKDSSWRMCVDYRKLNEATVKNKYPTPVVEDLLDELNGAKLFSKLDLRSGYHQIRMKEGEEHKTALKTHHGLWEFRVMPFGATLQDHLKHLELVSRVLRENQLVANRSKCSLAQTQVEYLGHIISGEGKGAENLAADALSRRFETEEEEECLGLSIAQPKWVSEVVESYENDQKIQELLTNLSLGPNAVPNISL